MVETSFGATDPTNYTHGTMPEKCNRGSGSVGAWTGGEDVRSAIERGIYLIANEPILKESRRKSFFTFYIRFQRGYARGDGVGVFIFW
jgi:hypothetical protein